MDADGRAGDGTNVERPGHDDLVAGLSAISPVPRDCRRGRIELAVDQRQTQ